MSREEPFVLSVGGRDVHGVVHLPEREGPRPAVLVCHGFKGFMEWGFFPPLADLLAERGFTAVRFNFPGNGMKPGDELVSDPEAFRTAKLSREVDEILALLDALAEGRLAPGRVDADRLGLVGHSRGGATSILATARAGGRVRALVTWSAVANYLEFYGPEARHHWRERGSLKVANARTGQELEVGVEVLDDLEAGGDSLVPERAAARIDVPWLVVHGTDDEAVPVGHARRLAAAAGGPHEPLEVPATGHTFGAVHPFAGPTPELVQVMNATQTWLRRHLG